jgi:lysophospholipase L1-like esterase
VLWTPPPGPIRIVLVGDSTASDVNGWGLGMPAYLASNAQFVNYAIPGTSTRLFLRSDEMNNMILLRPDVVLVQLGMMDTAEDQTIGTSLADYADNLRTIVRTVRGFEGTPILLTTHAARYWDGAGKVLPTWQDRNAVVKAVAAELGTDLIDLYQSTLELYSELGKDGSRYMESIYFPGEAMHFSPEGARVIAGLVARSFPSSLRPYVVLTGTDPQPP